MWNGASVNIVRMIYELIHFSLLTVLGGSAIRPTDNLPSVVDHLNWPTDYGNLVTVSIPSGLLGHYRAMASAFPWLRPTVHVARYLFLLVFVE